MGDLVGDFQMIFSLRQVENSLRRGLNAIQGAQSLGAFNEEDSTRLEIAVARINRSITNTKNTVEILQQYYSGRISLEELEAYRDTLQNQMSIKS